MLGETCIRVENLGCRSKAILAHGGAGGWDEKRVKEALNAVKLAVVKAYEKLDEPLLSVVEAVKSMEDSGVLNAGLGAVPAIDGSVELDAGLASSEGLIGAVAAVPLRNPILAALVVALETPHMLLVGSGAAELARKFGVEEHPGVNPRMIARLVKSRVKGDPLSRIRSVKQTLLALDTVGAVAVNKGRLAAATSTGGIFAKLRGRVGDTPIYGAGFYADHLIACSATGIGESIMITMPCLRLAILASREGELREEHVRRVIEEHTRRFGCGTLGLIIVDRRGCMYAATNAKIPIAFNDGGSVTAYLVKAV